MATHEMLAWLEQQAGKTCGNFIDGKWVDSKSGEVYPLYHAARRDQVLAWFQDSNEEDVEQAVQSAHRAFKSWSRVPGPERGRMLMRFADLIENHIDELSYMLSAEQGKVLGESRGEVARAAKEARFCAGEASRIQGDTFPGERPNVWTSTLYHPIGVIAAIAPWNFPVVTPIRKIAPALAYGCTVVFKPASATPWASVKIMELLKEAGFPNGTVNLVTGNGSRIGEPLVEHPLVRGISFTGSTRQGIAVNEHAAKRLARTQLELGGKNAAIVLEHGNLASAAKQIVSAAFTCSGQRCTAISRVIVLQHMADDLTDAILKEMRAIKVGPAWDPKATLGPLVNGSQLDAVQAYVKIGVEEGARLVAGGNILTEGEYKNGHYMMPALFDRVTPEMRIAKEEIFGPVLSMIPVENEEAAVETANAVQYGLAASIFTDHLSAAFRVAERLECGMVHVNHGTASAAHVPFGGVKNSGFGAYSIGSSNKEFFNEMKAVYFQYDA